jgi:hypothetical protein
VALEEASGFYAASFVPKLAWRGLASISLYGSIKPGILVPGLNTGRARVPALEMIAWKLNIFDIM